MNLCNSLRRLPLVGRPLAAYACRPPRRGVRVGLVVCANAASLHVGPFTATVFPGGRGIDRHEVIRRGPRDWHASVSRTVRGRHAMLTLDRCPTWRRTYR